MTNIRSIPELQKALDENPKFKKDFLADPVETIKQLPTEIPNTPVYRIVVGALGLSILLVIIGVIILAALGEPIDPTVTTLFTAIASGAVGALSGLLAPSPKAN